ncbi:hypothetical protein HFO56_39275 [Rhizobium laguerreae]|uniref:hypothetical protein n=1 Tax=Rhizobium laguerreae TaxID=1076926 RepID=UPI001C900937|nr:hypothetical protein [Rhizobium laguerreae]MBY3158343.1 hypothetical protein [Rhizobium laguerreae]
MADIVPYRPENIMASTGRGRPVWNSTDYQEGNQGPSEAAETDPFTTAQALIASARWLLPVGRFHRPAHQSATAALNDAARREMV